MVHLYFTLRMCIDAKTDSVVVEVENGVEMLQEEVTDKVHSFVALRQIVFVNF